MKQVIAVQKVWYAGSERQPGCEPFDMDDADARILAATDLPGGPKVKLADAKAFPVSKAQVELVNKDESLFGKQAMTTESDLVADPNAKRKYRRRDMVAED